MDNKKTLPSKTILFIIAGVLIFLSGFFIGKIDLANHSDPKYRLTGDLKSEYKGVDVDILWEVWQEIEDNYIHTDINGQILVDGAIKGLVNSLNNPYNSYLTKAETEEYLESNAGEFEGIGATLRFVGQYTQVETPIEGFPAQKAGLAPGDAIIEVNGEDVIGKSAYEVAELIKGEAGTTVNIKIIRQGQDNPLEFDIVRQKIDLDSITYAGVEDGISTIKITQFTEDNLINFMRQWDNVANEVQKDQPDKIIIDLRNNPGGYVDGVIYVLSDFFDKDILVMSERDKFGNTDEKRTTKSGKFKDTEVIVLVNQGSASAAEIFAGAIQDNDRGEIVGMKTIGKGVEQRIISLSNGATLHIVFQEWVLPSGRVVDEDNPIGPDYEVDRTDEDYQNKIDPQWEKAAELLSQ